MRFESALPDYFQIKEFDLMKAFAEAVSPEMGTVLQTALAGIGPFKAFRSTVKDFGLIEAWRDFRNQRFLEIATEWWDKNIEPALAARKDEIGPAAPTSEQRQVTPDGKLIVDPATLNGIALIETIRVLFRRVGPGDFEEALDELRDALCSLSCQPSEEQ